MSKVMMNGRKSDTGDRVGVELGPIRSPEGADEQSRHVVWVPGGTRVSEGIEDETLRCKST